MLDRLRLTYAGKMGVQYMHIDNPEERAWFEQRMEPAANQWSIDPAAQKRALEAIVLAAGFETFLDNRFKGHKRFSLEGGETMTAVIEELLERAAAANVREGLHRHGASRPADAAGQHHRQGHRADVLRI